MARRRRRSSSVPASCCCRDKATARARSSGRRVSPSRLCGAGSKPTWMVGLITSICADLATSSSTHARRCWTPASRANPFRVFPCGSRPSATPYARPQACAGRTHGGSRGRRRRRWRATHLPSSGGRPRRGRGLSAGIRVPYSCKGGMCCTCRAKLVEGKVAMLRNFSLESWEIDAGFVLTCQAQPGSNRVVLDYDQM